MEKNRGSHIKKHNLHKFKSIPIIPHLGSNHHYNEKEIHMSYGGNTNKRGIQYNSETEGQMMNSIF